MTPTTPLAGQGVLVTRPAKQARLLCDLVEAAGAACIRCPVLDIHPLPVIKVVGSAVSNGQSAQHAGTAPDTLVFISANAVIHGLARVGDVGVDWRRADAVMAVGPATQGALEAQGVDNVVVPTTEFSHLGLLALDELQSLSGRHIGIICGSRGSEPLAEKLRDRGAEVTLYRVYERRLNQIDMAPIIAKWRAGEINLMILTSVEVARGLKSLLAAAYEETAALTPWIAPSARVADGCRNLGMHARSKVAESALDAALVQAAIDLSRVIGRPG